MQIRLTTSLKILRCWCFPHSPGSATYRSVHSDTIRKPD